MSFPIPPEDNRSESEVNHDVWTGLPYDKPDAAELAYSADFLHPTTSGGTLPIERLAEAIRNPKENSSD